VKENLTTRTRNREREIRRENRNAHFYEEIPSSFSLPAKEEEGPHPLKMEDVISATNDQSNFHLASKFLLRQQETN